MHKSRTRPPTMEDLKDCLDNAKECPGQPEMYSWKKENKPNYLLTVTYGAGSAPPTWIMHAGDGENAAVVWIAMTTQPAEILKKIKDTLEEAGSDTLTRMSQSVSHTNPTGVLQKGSIFADSYEIISKLGHGGMGIVYKTKQLDNGRIVALKVLHPHLISDKLSRARFDQEARKSNLSHPNLIRIFKFGFSPNDQPFIAMEFLNGCPLTELLENGALSLAHFKSIFTQVCEGVAYAHSKGVIHRDIKPGNIMICNQDNDAAGLSPAQQILHDFSHPIVKIVDFGIAKTNIVGTHSKLTPTGDVLGSPHYMAPEQCAGGTPDPRSDIYSIGIVMYEAATGSMPFSDPNPIKLLLKQISEPPPGFVDYLHEGSYSLEQERIVMKALEKDLAQRYQTAEELHQELVNLPVTQEVLAVKGADISPNNGGNGTALIEEENGDSQAEFFENEEEELHENGGSGKRKKKVTFRFRRFTETTDKDLIMRGLDLSKRLLKKGADLSIFLDYEATHLAQRSNLMAPEFHVDFNNTEKIKSIQTAFQKIIKAGGAVTVSDYWLRYYGIHLGGPGALVSGVKVMNDAEQTEYLLERSSTFLDYT